MEINLADQRPSALPAACVPVTHESFVGRSDVWAPPMPGGPARRRLAPNATSGYGTSGSIDRKIAGIGVTVVNGQFTGAARGVPPRGRPV